MRRLSPWFGSAFLVGLMSAGAAWAHHSVQAQFDIHKTITISGTVAKMEFINPHSYLTLNVKDAEGKMQKWAFELGGPAALRRAGMSRADRGGLKPGDEVTAIGLAARDGSQQRLPSGIEVSRWARNQTRYRRQRQLSVR